MPFSDIGSFEVFVGTPPAPAFEMPAGVPDPFVWFNPEIVTYATGSDIATIPNQGTAGATYDATANVAAYSTTAVEAGWGGKTVFKPGVSSELTFAAAQALTLITIATYGDGTTATFSNFSGLIDGNGDLQGIVGDSGSANLSNLRPVQAILDGLSNLGNQASVLPLNKTTIGSWNTANGSGLTHLFADDFAASRSWGLATGGTVGHVLLWDTELTAQQITDVCAALDAYYL
jgi:hypothetical protein